MSRVRVELCMRIPGRSGKFGEEPDGKRGVNVCIRIFRRSGKFCFNGMLDTNTYCLQIHTMRCMDT